MIDAAASLPETHDAEDSSAFRVGLTRSFRADDGTVALGDIGLTALDDEPGVTWSFLDDGASPLPPGSLAPYRAALVLGEKVDAHSLEGADDLRLVARFGVGYDNVDVAACTAAGVAVTITPEGTRRPMALAAVSLLLAVAHNLRQKDAIVRGRRDWSERGQYNGIGLTGRSVGFVGFGSIGQETAGLLAGFDLTIRAYDPHMSRDVARARGVELVPLEVLLGSSDAVIITAALTPETHHLIDAVRLRQMKPTAILINVARGPLVDQRALHEALADGIIWGAGLDVLEVEPPSSDDPILDNDRVLFSPHGTGFTDQLIYGNGSAAIRSILEVVRGERPTSLVVNPDVFEHPAWSARGVRP